MNKINIVWIYRRAIVMCYFCGVISFDSESKRDGAVACAQDGRRDIGSTAVSSIDGSCC